ncbi:hypothetical protein, conserved [Leishmania tarentolae]|uniref:Uncharacterized protein n=1 Tax=Leishmania tarentolae TaxID=5689 RepID=A0A640KR66_LEITA|nr:hypothetical protein, conserved [Leishmania tarentolae]
MQRRTSASYDDRGESATVSQRLGKKPHSLMDELPPRPPSPYKWKQHRQRDGDHTSVTRAFMRGRRHMRVRAAAMSSVAASLPPLENALIPAIPSCAFPMHALVDFGTPNCGAAKRSYDDETVFERFLCEVQSHYYVSAEENMRNQILAGEEFAFTNLTIEALRERAELLAGDSTAALVIRDAQRRAEQRQAMMKEIEENVSLRLHEQRMEQLLAIELEALMPAHAAGYERIVHEEAASLGEVFRWHKENRPLGAGCFIKAPEEDSRLKYALRSTTAENVSGNQLVLAKGCNGASSVRSSRMYLAQLLQKGKSSHCSANALGPLAITAGGEAAAPASVLDGTLPVTDEALFAEEGRARLQAAKDRRYRELRGLRAVMDLQEAAMAEQQEVLGEEAAAWMQITGLEVEGFYAAKEATRQRKKQEAIESAATSDRVTQKNEAKVRLLRQRGLPVDEAGDGDGSTNEGAQPPMEQPAAAEPAARESRTRRSSSSTVTENSPRSGVAGEAENTPATANADADDELMHLRLVTDGITDPDGCKQLSALARREVKEAVEKTV